MVKKKAHRICLTVPDDMYKYLTRMSKNNNAMIPVSSFIRDAIQEKFAKGFEAASHRSVPHPSNKKTA